MAPGPTTTATTSTRWCPTPEQLMILEEMYRGGVRTPNATQIQQITAHLSLYGKIEGKNVFYWFQNHKARDRQKLRRRLAKHLLLHHQHHQHQLLYYHHPHPQFSHQIQTQTPRHHHHQLFNSIHPTNSTLCAPLGTHEYYASSSPCLPQMDTNHDKFKDDEAAAMRTHDDDWVVISSELNSRPVKTLELFPVTSSSCNINEESGF